MQYKSPDSTDYSPAGWIRCQDYNNNYLARLCTSYKDYNIITLPCIAPSVNVTITIIRQRLQ